MDQTKPTTNRITVGAIVTMAIVGIVGNILGTVAFFEFAYPAGPIWAGLLCFALGLLIAQPCLLAVWSSMAHQVSTKRIACSMGILAMLFVSYVTTFCIWLPPPPGIVVELIATMFLATMVLMVFVHVPLWIFRFRTNCFIGCDNGGQIQPRAQFGIKHLFIAMTVAALLIAISQLVFPLLDFRDSRMWIDILGFSTIFIVLVSVVAFLCTATVFSNSRRLQIGTLLFLVVAVGAWIAESALSTIDFPESPYSLLYTYLFTISLTLSILGVLGIFYAIGFRLQQAK